MKVAELALLASSGMGKIEQLRSRNVTLRAMHGRSRERNRGLGRDLGQGGSWKKPRYHCSTTNPQAWQPKFWFERPDQGGLIGGICEALSAPTASPSWMGPSWSLLIERRPRNSLHLSGVGNVDFRDHDPNEQASFAPWTWAPPNDMVAGTGSYNRWDSRLDLMMFSFAPHSHSFSCSTLFHIPLLGPQVQWLCSVSFFQSSKSSQIHFNLTTLTTNLFPPFPKTHFSI